MCSDGTIPDILAQQIFPLVVDLFICIFDLKSGAIQHGLLEPVLYLFINFKDLVMSDWTAAYFTHDPQSFVQYIRR